jgi:hypothetical protein
LKLRIYNKLQRSGQLMRLRLEALMTGLALSLSVGVLSAQAQFSDAQVRALVEALRQAAPPDSPNDGLYSEWQVKPENIPRWAKFCTGREITPAEFENNPATARSILVCIVRDVLKEEYPASNGNTSIAIRRTAAWWMTGDSKRYNSGDVAIYTQKVLSLYQQQNVASANQKPTPAPTANQPRSQSTPYDRYMNAGYAATQQKDYSTALIHFQRALDERPTDTFATQAIRNVESYLKRDRSGTSGPTLAAPPAATPPARPTPDSPVAATPSQPPASSAPPSSPAVAPPIAAPPSTAIPSIPLPSPTATPPLTPAVTPAVSAPSALTRATSTPTTPPTVTIVPVSGTDPVTTTPPAQLTTPITGAPLAASRNPVITENQAIDLIRQWLQAKAQIFAPPFAQKPIAELTTGELYTSLLKPDGVLDWLKQRQAYYRYGVQKVEAINRFAASDDRATIEITLTEERTLYRSGVIDPQQTAFATKQVRFSLEWADARWKIADYKTIDGSLLERAVLGPATTAEQ